MIKSTLFGFFTPRTCALVFNLPAAALLQTSKHWRPASGSVNDGTRRPDQFHSSGTSPCLRPEDQENAAEHFAPNCKYLNGGLRKSARPRLLRCPEAASCLAFPGLRRGGGGALAAAADERGKYENVDVQLTLLNSLQAWESAAPAGAVVSPRAVI